MGKKIAQIILAIIIVGLVYVIYVQISTPIRFEEEKKEIETKIIERIKDIRTAQRAYRSKYQKFAPNFDSLTAFILNDTLVLERKIVDEDDSVGMAQLKKSGQKNIETFKVAVIDTIFAPRKLSADQVNDIRFVPETGKTQFIMGADTIRTESKVVIPVVECRVSYTMYLDTVKYRQNIINLIDDQVNNFNRYPGIKFGSMDTGNNEAGNWE